MARTTVRVLVISLALGLAGPAMAQDSVKVGNETKRASGTVVSLTATAIAGSKFVAQGATGITHDALWSWFATGPVTSDLPGAGAERPLPR